VRCRQKRRPEGCCRGVLHGGRRDWSPASEAARPQTPNGAKGPLVGGPKLVHTDGVKLEQLGNFRPVTPREASAMKPLMTLIVFCSVGACASRAGSKPVPPHTIATAADTHIPDAGDASPADEPKSAEPSSH